jgi:hypothetical protein
MMQLQTLDLNAPCSHGPAARDCVLTGNGTAHSAVPHRYGPNANESMLPLTVVA